nr:MBL fold metallo-hydrolase [Aureimonas altamirensis]
MPMMRPVLLSMAILPALATLAFAQSDDAPSVASSCLAMASTMPRTFNVAYTPVRTVEGTVRIDYAGHSTYRIETPGGVTIATDYSGFYGSTPLPRIVTMNKAHRTHYTETPDPGIEHVLRGWGESGPARHGLAVDDVVIRNVTTDIRRWGASEPDANSIFIFEVAGLCIGHLGHLHHELTNDHYARIGRLDVVMVPVDGGLTSSLANMEAITRRLSSSVVLPMHRNATSLASFTGRMGDAFEVRRLDGDTLDLSVRTLPERPTIFIPASL